MNESIRWLFAFVLVFLPAGLAFGQDSPATGASSSPAPSHGFGLRIEPGLGFPLSSPQSDRFDMGAGQTVKGFYNLTPWLDVGPTLSVSDFPAADGIERSGTAWDFGAGLRLKQSVPSGGFFGLLPWIDSDVLYTRTGELDRPGFDVGAGLSTPFGPRRALRLGPFIRYRHIFQSESNERFDNRDAKLFHVGISLEFGAPISQTKSTASAARAESTEKTECPPCREPARTESLPDGDDDGFPDKYDRCPTAAGPESNFGCPEYEDVEVLPDRISLEERVYFDWDKADIQEASYPVLDEAAKAMKENPGFKVRVEGHADATGLESYNQRLSERRAEAVVDHLVEQGVDRDRFVIKGYSSSRPADDNLTDAGRQKNRRVEFVIDLEIIEKPGSNQ